jgi:hypothetical protein
MKKGELTSKQIVTLTILVLSFVIILFLFFQLDLGETTKREICHNSVVLASKSKGFSSSLDCRTNYLCISGGEECEGFSSDKTISVDLEDNKKAKEIIMSTIADEMADCWWMFGEGDIEDFVFGERWKYHCAICSQIKFDSVLQDSSIDISAEDLINFLGSASNEDGVIYSTYLYPSLEVDFVDRAKITGIDFNEGYSIILGYDVETWVDDDYIPVSVIPIKKEFDLTQCQIFDLTKS